METIGNLILSEYAEALRGKEVYFFMPESRLLRESEEELINSHLFNLAQAELIVGPLNDYLQDEISVGRLLGFLNAEAECIESFSLTVKEKKQRYVIIIANALASTLWNHPLQQKRFLDNCKRMIGIDPITWSTQTSRIRNAAASDRTVSFKAIQLREELYEQLGIPPEHRL